jgi:hypothetical protein
MPPTELTTSRPQSQKSRPGPSATQIWDASSGMPDPRDLDHAFFHLCPVYNPAGFVDKLPDTGIIKLRNTAASLREPGEMLNAAQNTLDETDRSFWTRFGDVGGELFEIKTSRRGPHYSVDHSADSSLTLSWRMPFPSSNS